MSELTSGRVLDCEACNRKVSIHLGEEFDYTKEGAGPYCYVCWFFMRHIEALRDRVTDLEQQTKKQTKKRWMWKPGQGGRW
jgi:hypothetical protein